MGDLNTILIANRGEIAVRIIRTVRTMGRRAVAVYSQADAGAPHVVLADDAVLIGPAPVSESYLDPDRILEAARATGADAVHPGYGFLSENAGFAAACVEAGLTFIGPSPEAIAAMGNKADAKRRMIAAGVPCVPGYGGEDQSTRSLIDAGRAIGFPLMVKAAAGGGGRGMRLVLVPDALPDALALARSEAENAFGSDELILERAIVRPRHVEFQVFGDSHGSVVHMGERDCSVQRRHQKVIEEAPCPVLTPDLRARMGEAAVTAARAIGYEGAGTVEFLLGEDGAFYFLEMNTRLQVEHPVTELVTGLDLVALQIHVAEGRPLGLRQEDVTMDGHAIEARLYAEDPAQTFLPATGTIALWQPAAGEGVRVDTGIASGQVVSPFYDPMIAKVMAHGPTRDVARRRLAAALKETALFGLRTNRGFLIDCLEREAFARGAATTAFIAEEFGAEALAGPTPDLSQAAMAGVIDYTRRHEAAAAKSRTPVGALKDWISADTIGFPYRARVGDMEVDLTIMPLGADRYRVHGHSGTLEVGIERIAPPHARLQVEGRRRQVLFLAPSDTDLHLQDGSASFVFHNTLADETGAEDAAGGGRITAPMHGRIVEIFVEAGQTVVPGDRLAILEAMKMQHEILAEAGGTVALIHAEAGAQVAANAMLFDIEVASP
ncbi:MAG: acetyl/propionyl/methylcrotonyl-CoA carboxylase subunit alpha [Alphaproteobacteria bacterium]